MKISQRGIDLIKQFEGFRMYPYKDQAGHMTIGYGHKILPEEDFGLAITYGFGEELLKKDLAPRETAVNKLVDIPLKQHQFDALVSFVYNVGEDAFRKSTLLKYLNLAKIQSAGDEFLRWDKITVKGEKVVSPGLHNRRVKERELFLGEKVKGLRK